MTDEKPLSERRDNPRYRRIEGIAVWAIPGLDAETDNLPERIPDDLLSRMSDSMQASVKEKRSSESA